MVTTPITLCYVKKSISTQVLENAVKTIITLLHYSSKKGVKMSFGRIDNCKTQDSIKKLQSIVFYVLLLVFEFDVMRKKKTFNLRDIFVNSRHYWSADSSK